MRQVTRLRSMIPGARPDAVGAAVTMGPVPRIRSYRLPQTADLDNAEELNLLSSGYETLTGDESRKIPVPRQMRGFVCVLSNGVMLVSKSHRHHAIVTQVLEQMDRAKVTCDRFYAVEMSVIQSFYDRGERRAIAQSSMERMQKDVFSTIEKALSWNATDIVIETNGHRGSIRFCVNDQMIHVDEVEGDYCRLFLTSMYNLCKVSDGTYRENDFQAAMLTSTDDAPLPKGLEAVRMQFGPTAGKGRAVVARLLPSRTGRGAKRTLKDLGYDAEHIHAMQQIRENPFGVIFFTGPTGSGKSTTLAVSLETRYYETQERLHITSVEDPAEYEIRGCRQHEIANAFSQDERQQAFIKAFNAVLRMKPHVIMVGEVRDLPAAQLLLKASTSGHQCWTSIHAKDALTVPARLKGMGVEPYIVTDSSILVGMVFQRLVPKLCECARPFDRRAVTGDVGLMVDIVCDGDHRQLRMRNRQGCERCRKSVGSIPGYAGQTVVAEVLQPDDDILIACVEGRRKEALNRWLENPIAVTAFEHGVRKILRGELDPQDVFDRVYDRNNLLRLQNNAGRLRFVREGRQKPSARLIGSDGRPASTGAVGHGPGQVRWAAEDRAPVDRSTHQHPTLQEA